MLRCVLLVARQFCVDPIARSGRWLCCAPVALCAGIPSGLPLLLLERLVLLCSVAVGRRAV